MSYFSRYDKGDWKAICDVCGREFKASQLNKRWDGLMCCRQDWEPRQPQDFVRGVSDPQLVPWTRPEPSDDYLAVVTSFFSAIMSTVKTSLLAVKFTGTQYLKSLVVNSSTTNTLVVTPSFTPNTSIYAVNGDVINNQVTG